MRVGPLIAVLCVLASHVAVADAAPPSSKCVAAAESGQLLRVDGKLIAARRKLAACTAPECPVVIRRDCARWIEELDAATPSITIRLEDGSGAETTSGTVTLDGEPLPPVAEGRSTPLDPGTHRLVWEHDGKRTEKEIVVREGERSRAVILRAEPLAAKPLVGPPAPAVGAGDSASSSSPLPWIVGGVGLSAAGIGIGFWLSGLGDHSSLGRTCAAEHVCADSDIDSARTKLIVGDVLVGVGVVLMAGALYFLLRDPPMRQATTAHR